MVSGKSKNEAGLPKFVVERSLSAKDVMQLMEHEVAEKQRFQWREHVPTVDTETDAGTQEVPERINWAEGLLGIPQIWWKTQGEGVKVAVLDTGCDVDHPDLKDAIVAQKNFTGGSANDVEDRNGHGTHCAGIIAARKNQVGFIGVAPKADLVIGKVLGDNGSGSFEGIAEGVKWATKQGAKIISMSLGGPVSAPALFGAVHEALAAGVMVVCAAGNSGSLHQNSIGYPGRYGTVITVGSHDQNGNPSEFSSRGGEVDFLAPGSRIWSTYKDGGYAELSGTSMATPFVAGLSALVLAKHTGPADNNTPLRNNAELAEHLLRMAAHPGWHDNRTGYGPLLPFSYFSS